jgi:HK97 gp10 family phage protein
MAGYITGLDNALKYVKQMEKELESDVRRAVKESSYLMEAQAKALAPVRTNYLRSNIKTTIKDGGMSSEVISHAEYSLFVEFGTSKQEAQPYMMPSYFKARNHFENLLRRRG